MTTSILKILTITSLILSTSTFAATKKELDKSSPMLAKSSSNQNIENQKLKPKKKQIDKSSTKSSHLKKANNPLYKPASSKASNPMYQPSQAIQKPKDKASGKSTGKRAH